MGLGTYENSYLVTMVSMGGARNNVIRKPKKRSFKLKVIWKGSKICDSDHLNQSQVRRVAYGMFYSGIDEWVAL